MRVLIRDLRISGTKLGLPDATAFDVTAFEITGKDVIDFIKFRQLIAQGATADEATFEAVLGKPQG